MSLKPTSSAAEIAKAAVTFLKHEPPTGEFNIKSLFSKSEWEALDPGQRKQAGKLFKHLMAHSVGGQLNGPDTANLQHYEVC